MVRTARAWTVSGKVSGSVSEFAAAAVRDAAIPTASIVTSRGFALRLVRAEGASDLYLVAGLPPSIRVAGAIRHAPGIGHGHGPLDHFWQSGPDPGVPGR